MGRQRQVKRPRIAKIRTEYQKREQKRHRRSAPFDELASDFISMVSHELRTPLAIVREGLALVQENKLGPTTDKQQQALRLGLDSIDRLVRLVDELLDISRLEKGKVKLHKRLINLSHFTEEIFHSFENIVRSEGKFFSYERLAHEQKLTVYADKDKLTQVMINLIQNALKHTTTGDSIKLIVGDEGGNGYVVVKDEGLGIPRSELNNVFKKFHQVQNDPSEQKGLGLGLTIASEIVKLHGGKILVKSAEGKGSEFIVKIALAIPGLASLTKLIHRHPLTKEEMKELRHYGLIKLLVEAIEYPGLSIDEKEELLEAVQELKLCKGVLPSIWDHIEDFRRLELRRRGKTIKAANYKEAFLMAYIEKNMGEFVYRGKPIYQYPDTNRKREALISLVKELSPRYLEEKLLEIERGEAYAQ